jgi:hypothetical protein
VLLWHYNHAQTKWTAGTFLHNSYRVSFPGGTALKGSHFQLVSILIMSGSVPPLSMRRHDSFLNTNENTGKKKFEVTQPVKYFECVRHSYSFISLSARQGISWITRRLQASWALCSMDLPFVQIWFHLIYSKIFIFCLFPLPHSGTRSDHPNTSNEHQMMTVWFETWLLFFFFFAVSVLWNDRAKTRRRLRID